MEVGPVTQTLQIGKTTAGRPAVVYDGACGFCRRQVERIRRQDRHDQFEYLPRDAPELPRRFPQLEGMDFNKGMRLVDADGRVFVGADAAHAIARRLPFWRRIAWLYRVPGIHAAARGIYGWIAANRRRLGGRCETDACDRP